MLEEMSVLDKIKYLRQFSSTVTIISLDEIDEKEKKLIPREWKVIFEEQDKNIRFDLVLQLWKKYVPNEMRKTIIYLQENLRSIDLIRQEFEYGVVYSILYGIESMKGRMLYYQGKVPSISLDNDDLINVWDKIPFSIRKFYENLHDGFFYFAGMCMGLVPLKYIEYLGDPEMDWAIIDELEEPLQINMETSFGFFCSGMGGYVVIDYTNCIGNKATLWSAKGQPMYNQNFWLIVDEWTVMGFE